MSPPRSLTPTESPKPITILPDIDHPYLLSWGVACLDNTAQIAEINQKQSSYQHPHGAKLHKTSASQKGRGKKNQRKNEGGKKPRYKQTNIAGESKGEEERRAKSVESFIINEMGDLVRRTSQCYGLGHSLPSSLRSVWTLLPKGSWEL